MMDYFVSVLMTSDADLQIMQRTLDTLDKFGVTWEARITSAHRTPTATMDYVKDAESRGCRVYIAASGLAAHLAGAVAAQTTRPVIGVPLDAGTLGGTDSLHSTVQMPGGIPVATVAIGKPGATNAGYLAAQMLSVLDDALATRLVDERSENASAVEAKNRALQEKLGPAKG